MSFPIIFPFLSFSRISFSWQTTLLQFWEKTAHAMSGIHKAFRGYIPYQFTTLKVDRQARETHKSQLYKDKECSLRRSFVIVNVFVLQDLRDPLEELTEAQQIEDKKEKAPQSNTDR